MAVSALADSKPLHVPAAYGEPPEGWTWSRLDDVTEGIFDCPHSTPTLTESGPFVVRTQDIITGNASRRPSGEFLKKRMLSESPE